VVWKNTPKWNVFIMSSRRKTSNAGFFKRCNKHFSKIIIRHRKKTYFKNVIS
jgi:hypothetical protein